MGNCDRRRFLKMMGSGAIVASLPGSIQRALAVPAHHRTGTIEDVEHIVVLTQENRAFDHYFGTMRGVRGFSDPRAVKLPSGMPVWNQPTSDGYLLPFRPDVADMGITFLPDVSHGWNDSHAAWNDANYDQWVPNKGITSMTYHTRKDLPYHFALADAFTVCDAYHCSLMGPTDPNRYHLWTGWCGNDGSGGGPVISNAEVGYSWLTYPERLQQAGISWKLYQDVGDGLDAAGYWGWTSDPYIGNYGDNSLLYFLQYQNAQPGNPLADFAKTGTNILAENRDSKRLMDILRADVASGNLPQVSWIVAPEAFCEHPSFPGHYGAWYISQVLDALTSNPDVWSKTVLFINYDEGGGIFDHIVPPSPAQDDQHGASTVDTTYEIYPGDATNQSGPYGLGTRVPMLVVSPWSKGGYVNSQVFDHTSIIRFIETRYAKDYPDVIASNITPWRRAVVGDLASAFNFAKPDTTPVSLPSTAAYLPVDKVRHPSYDVVAPTDQSMPTQEPGIRMARPLPYELNAHGKINHDNGSFRIEFENTGKATAVFQVRRAGGLESPRSYTVEPNKRLSDSWDVTALGQGDYDLAVYAPNGFFRGFKGGILGEERTNLDVDVIYRRRHKGITLKLRNISDDEVKLTVLDKYTGRHMTRTLSPGQSLIRHWSLHRSYGWYDFVITSEEDSGFEYQLAGHIETGTDSISDPAMGGVKLKV